VTGIATSGPTTATGPTAGTGPAAAAGPTAGTGTAVDLSTTRQRAAQRWRRWRWWLVTGVAVLLGAGGLALLTPRTSTADLDPASATPAGSRAIAQILRQQGVAVSRVTRSTQLGQAAGSGATVVVVHPELLGPDQFDRLTALPGRLVLVEPDATTLSYLARFAQVAGTAPARDTAAGCPDPAAAAAGTARAGGRLYRLAPGAAGAVVCYPQPGQPGVGALLRQTSGSRVVTVLGQADVLRNGHLAEQGNAALALWVLGSQPSLVWYLPDPLELSASGQPPGLLDVAPRWVPWVSLQLVIAAVLALVWRARRFGRLVTEPLPVVVRSAETQEGRARLYRQAGARDRAAATLRTAGARRLAARFDVPAAADPATVVDLAARAAGRPATWVHDTLLGPAPRDDAALVRLADRLDDLEQAVSGTPPGRAPATPTTPAPDSDPSQRKATPR
jgi:hypothetical protein